MQIPHNYRPRPYQLPFLDAMDSGYRRACCVWHRRSGKTKTLLNFTVKKMFERIGTYYHCFPEYSQGRKVLWDGIGGDGVKFLDHFPAQVVRSRRNDQMQISMVNGSIYQIIGADNYDSVVGSNPVGLILDEWAISARYPIAWDYFRPILAENKGWAVFPYTPRGMNHGYTLYEMAKSNPEWFCQLLTAEDTGVVSREDIEAERAAGMSDDMVQQEFYCSFTVIGGKALNFSPIHHVCQPIPIPQDAPIYMAMDWGFGAPFAVLWAWIDYDGRIWVFDEWYGWTGTPNEGLRLEDSKLAKGIKEREVKMGISDRRNIIRLAGHDSFNKKPDYKGGGQGPSTAEIFGNEGIYLAKADSSRSLKIRQVRERLIIPADTRPMLQIYSTCAQTIRTLPLLVSDPLNIEDVDTTGEDHLYDALAQIAMARPIAMQHERTLKNIAEARIDMLEKTRRDETTDLARAATKENAAWDRIFTGENEMLDMIYKDMDR